MSTRYVASGGNNGNAGTIDAPWLTISYGVAQLFAGDNLYIRGGTYTGSLNAIISASTTVRGGTSWSNAITIAAYPGETVTIANTGTPNLIALTSSTQQYIIISDLILDATLLGVAGCVYLGPGSHHIRVQDSECFGAHSYAGINTAETNAGDNEFLRLKVHDNGEDNVPPGHGFYIQSPRNLIEGCESDDNYGWGIQIYAGNTDGNIVRNNWVHDNARGGQGGGIVVAGGPGSGGLGGVKVYNNIISGTHPDAYGLQVGSEGGSPALNFEILNNTILAPDAVNINSNATGTLLKNNILRTVNNAGAGSVVDNGTGTIQTTNLTSDPTFTNGGGSYALVTDFQIQTTSAAKDAGTTLAAVPYDFDGGARPFGAAYDIGAYEFGSTPGEEEEDEDEEDGDEGGGTIGTEIIFGKLNTSAADHGNEIVLITGEHEFQSTSEPQLMPIPGTFTSWTLEIDSALGVGNTRTYRIYKGNAGAGFVATDLVIVFGATETRLTVIADVHFAAGEHLTYFATFTGANLSRATKSALSFAPDVVGTILYGFHGSDTGNGRGCAPFMGSRWFIFASSPFNCTQVNRLEQTVTAMTMRAGHAGGPAYPGVGTSIIALWNVNGVDQDGSGGTVDTRLTLSGTNEEASITYSTPLSLAVGDEVTVILRTGTGAPSYANRYHFLFACIPTITGAYQLCGQGNNTLTAVGAVRYAQPAAGDWFDINWAAAEAMEAFIGHGVTDVAISGLWLDLSAALDASTEALTFTLRVNGADVGTPLVLSGVGAQEGAVTFATSVLIGPSDTWSLKGSNTGSTTISSTAMGMRWAFVPGVFGALPTVETLPATNVRSSSATLRGRIDPNGTAFFGRFRWWVCADSPPTFTETDPQSVGSGTQPVIFTANLTDLEPETTYCFQAIGDGGSPELEGAILSFTTSGEALFIDGTVSHPLTWMELYVD